MDDTFREFESIVLRAFTFKSLSLIKFLAHVFKCFSSQVAVKDQAIVELPVIYWLWTHSFWMYILSLLLLHEIVRCSKSDVKELCFERFFVRLWLSCYVMSSLNFNSAWNFGIVWMCVWWDTCFVLWSWSLFKFKIALFFDITIL